MKQPEKAASPPEYQSFPPSSKRHVVVPVVGIGASAGGLEALEKFFTHMPPDAGIAFVVVTHLNPDRASLLPEIIGRKTSMQVQKAINSQPVMANRVYFIPPGKTMTIEPLAKRRAITESGSILI
ncbi:chemotaxis protein CheB [Desulfopila aestuarii]|uniref:protein-glutamate methylesterase n=1 Tax=Desulfopila aestuarii DSM 18488 TaxID=1121416 RepID=A0A1M7YBB8_9BACT|nr:chemotaxis protein CheB [Desulfopila aestuarii]SHO49818.1 CheB methylesterase [Desulfopila aestuarii DSM 18488]